MVQDEREREAPSGRDRVGVGRVISPRWGSVQLAPLIRVSCSTMFLQLHLLHVRPRFASGCKLEVCRRGMVVLQIPPLLAPRAVSALMLAEWVQWRSSLCMLKHELQHRHQPPQLPYFTSRNTATLRLSRG